MSSNLKMTCDCGEEFNHKEGIEPTTTVTGDAIADCPSCGEPCVLTNSEMWEQVGEELTQDTLQLVKQLERESDLDDFHEFI